MDPRPSLPTPIYRALRPTVPASCLATPHALPRQVAADDVTVETC